MTLALQIDKDALIEFLNSKKDLLFILFLLVVLLVGGWTLYQRSAESVEEVIATALEQENRSTGPGMGGEEEITSTRVVENLLKKRPQTEYEMNRNPFGSPEDQMRMRKEVEAAYQRGIELFDAGQYSASIQQFERVIKMDVTETRYSYPILPSEYIRRAQREDLKQNFDRIYANAKSDFEEGTRLIEAGNLREAQTILQQADEKLQQCIDSDPQGEAIGEENLKKIKALQQQTFNKYMEVSGNLLVDDLNRGMSEAQTALNGSDFIAMLREMFDLMRLQQEIKKIDPNAKLVSRSQVNQLDMLVEQIRKKVSENFQALVAQADQQFLEAIQEEDPQKAKEAIIALRMAHNFQPGDKDLQKKISDYVARRADLMIRVTNQFISEQQALLNQGQYDQFDRQRKIQLMNELIALRDSVGVSNSSLRNQIIEVETKLKALRLPPPVTQDYKVISIQPSARDRYRIKLMDSSSSISSRERTLYLKEGETDRLTKITLKQVDTNGGFVILSKSGYTDAKVEISSNN